MISSSGGTFDNDQRHRSFRHSLGERGIAFFSRSWKVLPTQPGVVESTSPPVLSQHKTIRR